MILKFRTTVLILVSMFVIAESFNSVLSGQQIPEYPVSYRVFTPFMFNPAIAGSKDFVSVDILAGKYGGINSEVISSNGRLIRQNEKYYSSSKTPQFTHFGIGGSVFNEVNGAMRNTGIGATGSYHFALDDKAVSYLAVGLSGKIVKNKFSGTSGLADSVVNTIFTDFDAGIYYYSPGLFAGLSVTNIIDDNSGNDFFGSASLPVSRQFYFNIGYRIVLSKSLKIIIEPSVIVNSDDSFAGDFTDMIEPMLKLYAGNFCIGTYFHDFKRSSFFFQYKYPGFSLGTYFELPNNTAFYKQPLLAEIALGINLTSIQKKSARINHW